MSLKSILKAKDKSVDNLLSVFNSSWETMIEPLQRQIIKLFQSGKFSKDAIQLIFQQNGFDDLAGEIAANFNQTLKYSKRLSKELGYNFVLSEKNINLFDAMQEINLDRLLNTKTQIIDDMRRFAIESVVENRNVSYISSGLEMNFKRMGRYLNTEILTGINTYGAAIDFAATQDAGITKYQYVGPLDGKTRDSCTSTLNDSRQETGWTIDEINASETPFISRGGFNCRHQWVAFQ